MTAAGLIPADVAACKGDTGSFLCSLPFAARVNDWFFSHACGSNGRTISQILSDLRAGIERDGFHSKELVGADSPLEGRPSADGRQWFDSGIPAQDENELLSAWAHALGVTHIVQGPEPSVIPFADVGDAEGGRQAESSCFSSCAGNSGVEPLSSVRSRTSLKRRIGTDQFL